MIDLKTLSKWKTFKMNAQPCETIGNNWDWQQQTSTDNNWLWDTEIKCQQVSRFLWPFWRRSSRRDKVPEVKVSARVSPADTIGQCFKSKPSQVMFFLPTGWAMNSNAQFFSMPIKQYYIVFLNPRGIERQSIWITVQSIQGTCWAFLSKTCTVWVGLLWK